MDMIKGGRLINPFGTAFNKVNISISVDMRTQQADVSCDHRVPLLFMCEVFLQLIGKFIAQLSQVSGMLVKPGNEKPEITEEKGGQDGEKENSDN